MNKPLVFDDLTRYQEPVTIGKVQYVLLEADEEVAAEYRNAAVRGAILREEGGVQIGTGTGSIQTLLVSRCLYRALEDGSLPLDKVGNPDRNCRVPEQMTKQWKASIVRSIFDRAKEISGLGEGEETLETIDRDIAKLQARRQKLVDKEEQVKNSQPGSMVGSVSV